MMTETGRRPDPEDREALLAFAEHLADAAAPLARSWFRRGVNVELKSDKSPVTEADRAIEAMVRSRIVAAYPTHGILGEEHGRERLDAEHVWIVDPIDGTRSFITGWPVWGTLIALAKNGRPDIGLIEMPCLGEQWISPMDGATIFQATSGEREVCRVSDCRRLANARFYTTSPLYFEDEDRIAVEHLARASATPRFGGDCYSYALLASGYIDLVVEAMLQPFDYFSLIPVIEGAGGVISDWSGKPLHMESDGRVVAAATPELHEEVLETLAQRQMPSM